MRSFARTSLLTAVILLPLSGCLLRTHKVERRTYSTAPLQEATAQQLIQRINDEAGKIKSLNATVDIAAAAGGEKKGKVTEFQEIRGYVLLRKPAALRMIGLYPVVRNKAFDMVSDGDRFRLYIPVKNKFFIGSKDVTVPSKNTLENLRPQHILDALLVREIDPQSEIAYLEAGEEKVKDPKTRKDVVQPNYILNVVARQADGSWALARKIFVSRIDLTPTKQLLFDRTGALATIASYDNYNTEFGLNFPKIIEVQRPQEEYKIQLGVLKMTLNQPLTNEQFTLAQPAGSEVVDLDKRHASAASPQAASSP